MQDNSVYIIMYFCDLLWKLNAASIVYGAMSEST